MPQKKNNFIKGSRTSWDEFFMKIALTATERVACLFHKVASVFVDENHKIISIGYNGPSVGDYHCNEVGCAKVHGDPITGEIKRCRGVHSEMNAIINAGDTSKLKGATLYITVFPCYDCMKALNNLGIKRIVYLDDYLRVLDGSDGTKKKAEPEARELAIKRGIICEQFRFEEKTKPSKTNITNVTLDKKEEKRF
ncbi:MAG: dCMP deaminase family protein [Patescibacteria group bacterium]